MECQYRTVSGRDQRQFALISRCFRPRCDEGFKVISDLRHRTVDGGSFGFRHDIEGSQIKEKHKDEFKCDSAHRAIDEL